MTGVIDLDLLRVFVSVAESTSFTRTARKLGLPRSAVSRRISRLEQLLGVRLFHRTTRRVGLSTAGAALFERVGPSIASIDEAVRDLPEQDDAPAGLLRITAPVDLATSVLPEVIAQFAIEHPAVSVDVSVSNEMIDLVAEGIDCALRIATHELRDSSLVARRIGELAISVYASPAYLEGRRPIRSPADLTGHEWVVFRRSAPLRITSGKRSVQVDPRGRVETDDMLFAHHAVRRGLGLGALPTYLTDPDVAAGLLVRVLPRWTARSGQLWMVWPGARHVPRKTLAFRDAMVAAVGVTDRRRLP